MAAADEYALSVAAGGGLHHGPEGGDGAPATADHLSGVVVRDVQLEDQRAVLLLEILHAHLVRTVDERPGEGLEELVHLLGGGFVVRRRPGLGIRRGS